MVTSVRGPFPPYSGGTRTWAAPGGIDNGINTVYLAYVRASVGTR
ncbi:hypothetical protein GCM10022419_009950 [Nonomuraea rosea]|uniref:Uncharacterized protein n=1 Tax=Nonomuraea rosea TaxID=638574 RepID=A0ABP6VCA9_9ACTN